MTSKGMIPEVGGLTDTTLRVLAKATVALTCKQVVVNAQLDPADRDVYRNYLSTLARLTAAGKVERAGATVGRFQHRPEVKWKITPEGKAWMWDIEDRRWRRDEEIMIACALGAAAEASPSLSRQRRADTARDLIALGATKKDIARVLGDKAALTAAAGVKYAKPAARVAFGPEHPAFDRVAGYLHDETGVKTDDVRNMLEIMRFMGLMIVMPPAWRVTEPEVTDEPEPVDETVGAQS